MKMTLSNALDNFEVCRWNEYRDWTAPSGIKLQLNREPYLDIVLTDRCNRHCKFCIADLLDKHDSCDIEVFKDQITWAVENVGIREVLLVGGEPTIAQGLFPIVEHLTKGVPGIKKICMTTNGDRLLTPKSGVSDFAKRVCSEGITHINLSLMSLDVDAQRKIGGSHNALDISRLPELYSLCQDSDVQLRINCNVFRGNNDTLDSLVEFYRAVAPNCDSVKFSPLLRVDNFSVVNKVLTFVAENILSDGEYETLFKSVEAIFGEQPIIRNPLTFGFVENSMILMDTPIVLNYNHRGQMATYAAMGRVNNVKLLTNGNLSLSWNKDDESKVIRLGKGDK